MPGHLAEEHIDGTATVRRIAALDIAYLRAIEGDSSERASAAREEAYREL